MDNQVNLVGQMITELIYDHSLWGEKFYRASVAVKRDSGKPDIIPLLICERLVGDYVGAYVHIKGEFRSYNQHCEEKTRLKLYVIVNELELCDEGNVNDVFLEGYVCKPPIYRHTPLGREICDIMLAINREYGKSDYIPCVFWGNNAYYVKGYEVGDRIRVAGRIQSREYTKDGEIKTAYEFSVNLFEKC